MAESVRLTRKQADTLSALRSAARIFTDTTIEVSAYDNSAPGTGARLEALERKGLCRCIGVYNHRAGRRWELTVLGVRTAEAIELRESRERGKLRRAGKPWTLLALDLGGTYEMTA